MFLHQKINHFQIYTRFKDNLPENSPEEIAKWRAERRARYPKIANNDNDPKTDSNETKISQDSENSFKNRGFKSNYSNNNFKRKFHQHYKSEYHGNKRFARHKQYQTNNGSRKPKYKNKNYLPSVENQNESTKSIKCDPPENPVAFSNSLNMLSCYASDENSDVEKSSPTKQYCENDEAIITDLLDKLIIKVDRKQTAEHTKSNLKKRLKKQTPCPPLPSYNQLTLFQKLMLQDVRKVKDELLYCMKYIVETNYLKNI